MLTNAEINRAVTKALNDLNITDVGKANGVTDIGDANFGDLLPKSLVWKLLDLSRSQSQWLSEISTVVVDRQAGTIPVFDLIGPVSEGVSNNSGQPVPNDPTTYNVAYSCKKLKAEWYVTYQQLREAAAGGITDFEGIVFAAFAGAMGNDHANLLINGNTALDSSTRLNRLLNVHDGLLKMTDSGTVHNAAGKKFGPGVFSFLCDIMPEKWQSEPNLKFLTNRRTMAHWKRSLTNVNQASTITRSGLGDRLIVSQDTANPEGIPPIIIPQLSHSMGPTPVAPTSLTASTTLVIRIATLAPDATSAAGRRVRVLCKLTGKEEVCVVTYNGSSQNIVTTTDLMGQSAASTTASDYTITFADESVLIHGNPKLINLVVCDEIRSYRVFNPKADRFEITTYVELSVVLPVPAALPKVSRLWTPPIDDWTVAA